MKRSKTLNYLMVLPITNELTSKEDSAYSFPAGFATVSAALKVSGRNVLTLNLKYKQDPEKWLKHIIVKNNVDVVFTGGMGIEFWNVKMVIDSAKKAKPDIITVVGGVLITADPATAMEALENADYGVIGEGEITINALAYALETKKDAAGVDGVICKRDGEWIIREKYPVVPNLDILPFPDYEGFEYSQMLTKSYDSFGRTSIYENSYVAYINTARSCPYSCTFCFHSCGSKHRTMSIDIVFKLIDWMFSLYPLEFMYICDELSFSDAEFTIEFCRRIKERNIIWQCFTRIDCVNKEILLVMKESGCFLLNIGIESADNNILKSMRKNITVEQLEETLLSAYEVGLNLSGRLIFGDPEETMDTFFKSLNWWVSNRKYIHESGVTPIFTFPGTHLYKIACERGIIKDRVKFLKDLFPLVNLSKMPDDEYHLMPVYFRNFSLENKLEDVEIKVQEDYTVNILGKCPLCFENIGYYHFDFLFNTLPLICPNCGKDITVNPIEYCNPEVLNKNTQSLVANGMAIWAVNTFNFYWLLKLMPMLKDDKVKFINKNDIKIQMPQRYWASTDYRTVKTLQGKTIFKPEIINIEHIDTIIVPNNTKIFSEIKEECALTFPHVKHIVHITELLNSDYVVRV